MCGPECPVAGAYSEAPHVSDTGRPVQAQNDHLWQYDVSTRAHAVGTAEDLRNGKRGVGILIHLRTTGCMKFPLAISRLAEQGNGRAGAWQFTTPQVV